METLELLLVMLGCVLISSMVDQAFSRLSLPLVQIVIGVIVGVFFVDDPAEVLNDPEVFLPLFIAPLLFEEARHLNKKGLWKNLGPIMCLAIGLVVVTMLAVGFAFNLLVPSIPLAVAFALGAALGPTDAVAVSALGSQVGLSEKQESRLSGEALFNDATGVITFEFAIAAAVTGTFSLAEATTTFLVEFFGGILVGIVLAAVIMFLLSHVVVMGIDSPTVYVLLELCTPFFAYFLGELLEVSGMLAVVAAGLFMRFYPSKLTVESSRYAMASETAWELVSYVVNGLIFVLLGMELPGVIMPTWNEAGSIVADWTLILIVLVVLIAVELSRFVFVFVMELVSTQYSKHKAVKAVKAGEEGAAMPEKRPMSDIVRDSLVMTFSGAKGAITMTVVLSIPYNVSSGSSFPERDLLIFVASCVIICSFLLANFVVPLLAPVQKDSEKAKERTATKVEILQNVIIGLKQNMTPENEAATMNVVNDYRARIDLARTDDGSDEHIRDMRLDILYKQLDFVRDAIQAGAVDKAVGEQYAGTLSRRISSMKKAQRRGTSAYKRRVSADAKKQMSTPISWTLRATWSRIRGNKVSDREKAELNQLIYETESYALDYIDKLALTANEQDRRSLQILRIEHIPARDDARSALEEAKADDQTSSQDSGRNISVTEALNKAEEAKEISRSVEAEALRMELDQIQIMYDEERLSAADVRELRSEVYVLQMGLSAR